MTRPEKLGDVIAAQVRKFRRAQDMSIRELSERCSELGAPGLTAASLSNIERGQAENARRGRRQVTVDELLVLAYALSVPPVALLLPLGDADRVAVIPGVEVHPHLALKWINGDVPTIGSDRRVTGDLKMHQQASLPLVLYAEHDRLSDEAYDRKTQVALTVRRAGSDSADAKNARDEYKRALTDWANWQRHMDQLGVKPPAIGPVFLNAMRDVGIDVSGFAQMQVEDEDDAG